MLTPWKLSFFIALLCCSGVGQISRTASIHPTPASSVASSPEQDSSKSKQEELKLEPIETSKAVYPPEAKEKKIQGQVVGTIVVSEAGTVESVQIFKGDALLRTAADEAVRKWRFKPVLKGGQPVPVTARTTFNFALADAVQDTNDAAGEVDRISDFPLAVRVSSGVIQGLILKEINPSYPEKARKARIQGTVLLHARISKEGKVGDLQVISGPEALIPSALMAVQQWEYRPYLLLGRPVEVDTEIQVNFTLSDG
jgi:TonB family protein